MPKTSTQAAAQGWTDELKVDWTDFLSAQAGTLADNATHTITYAVPVGAHVRNVGRKIVTAFTDSGSGAQLNVVVGDGVDPDGYLSNFAAHSSQTRVAYQANTGALIDNENGKVYTAADTIDILFTPGTGAPYSLNELTAGEIIFRFDIAQV